MDLTPSSEFVLRYTDEDDYMQVLKETFEPVDELFPESAFEFLDDFFSEVSFCTFLDNLSFSCQSHHHYLFI